MVTSHLVMPHIHTSWIVHMCSYKAQYASLVHVCFLGTSNNRIYTLLRILGQSQSSAGDLKDGTVVGKQRRGEFGKFSQEKKKITTTSTA